MLQTLMDPKLYMMSDLLYSSISVSSPNGNVHPSSTLSSTKVMTDEAFDFGVKNKLKIPLYPFTVSAFLVQLPYS